MVVYISSVGSNERKLSELLKLKHIPVELKAIQSGDIVIVNDKFTLGIERKTVNDLVCSLIGSKNSYDKSNRHLFSQLETLKATYQKTLLILEGKMEETDPHIKTFMGLYFSILCSWQIPILPTANLDDTADKVAKIYLKYGNYRVSSALPQAVHKAKTTKDIKISMLCTVDGIGIQTAKKLYNIEPMLIGTPLGEEYVEKILGENLAPKPKERLKKVLLNAE